jgi:hypothetical protein
LSASRLEEVKARWRAPGAVHPSPAALRCRAKFLRFFPEGFQDETYLAWERSYKWIAHEQWADALAPGTYAALLNQGRFPEIATHAVRVVSGTNLLSSPEKMALRDAVRTSESERAFASGLFEFLTAEPGPAGFDRWVEVMAALPRKEARVLTWPLVTVFGFMARPDVHMLLKPLATRAAARDYRFDLAYRTEPGWDTYSSLLEFVALIRRDVTDLEPRDMIDLQSFIRVQGSDEYREE